MRVLRGVVYMMKSRAPRTEPWRTPQEEVHKDEKVPSVQNGRTNRDAVWVEDSGGPKDACIRWGAHWRHLANTTEQSVHGGDAV